MENDAIVESSADAIYSGRAANVRFDTMKDQHKGSCLHTDPSTP